MDYPNDVLQRVRAALQEYRASRLLNGRKRTWDRIAEELFDEYLSDTPLEGDTDVIKALAEALRRFAAGTQVLVGERREALGKFLISNRVLSPEDLKGSPGLGPVSRALREFFEIEPEFDAAATQSLAGIYLATRKVQNNRSEISLLTIARDANGGVSVEDRIHAVPSAPPSKTYDGIKRYVAATGASTARYDGMLMGTMNGQVCMFVKNHVMPTAGVYVLLYKEGDTTGNKPSDVLLVIKSNDFGGSQWHMGRHGIVVVKDPPDRRTQILSFLGSTVWEYVRTEAP